MISSEDGGKSAQSRQMFSHKVGGYSQPKFSPSHGRSDLALICSPFRVDEHPSARADPVPPAGRRREILLKFRLPKKATRAMRLGPPLGGLGARLLLHADAIGQLDELFQIPPFLFAHQPSVRTRKINRHESFGGKG